MLYCCTCNRYINFRYKAGYPEAVTTKEEKIAFLHHLHEGMGIELKPDEVANNPALRSFAKSILVNLWGVSLLYGTAYDNDEKICIL